MWWLNQKILCTAKHISLIITGHIIIQWTRASSLFQPQSGTVFGFHRNKTNSVNTDKDNYSSLCKQPKDRHAKEVWRRKKTTTLEHDKTVRLMEVNDLIHDYIHLSCPLLLLWNTVGEIKRGGFIIGRKQGKARLLLFSVVCHFLHALSVKTKVC